MLTNLGSEHRELYRWQLDALVSWLRCGRRGVIEAVTGSGKTDVAIAAACRRAAPGPLRARASCRPACSWSSGTVGSRPRCPTLGSGGWATAARTARRPATCSSRPATRPPRTSRVPPGEAGGLLIADECHGLGGGDAAPGDAPPVRRTARPDRDAGTQRRRGDRAAAPVLRRHLPPLRLRAGHRRRRVRAASGGVRRRRRCRSRNGPSTPRPSSGSSSARHHLRQVRGMPLEPFGDFLAAVAHLAERDAGADGRAAREYLDAFSKRREIVAQIERQVRAARPAWRRRSSDARRRAGVHRDRARREPRHQPARSAGVDRPDHRVDGSRVNAGRSSTICASGGSTRSPRPACSTKASTCPTRTSAS